MLHHNRYSYLLRYILPFVDLVMINAVYLFIYYIDLKYKLGIVKDTNLNHVIVCNLVWLICTAFFGLYRVWNTNRTEHILRATYKSIVVHFLLYLFYLAYHKEDHFTWKFVGLFYFLIVISFILNRFVGTTLHFLVFKKLKMAKKVAVMGEGDNLQNLLSYINRDHNLENYGVLGDEHLIYDDSNKLNTAFLTTKLVEASIAGVKDIYVAVEPSKMDAVQLLVKCAEKSGLRIKFVPNLGLHLTTSYRITYLDNELPIITLRNEPLEEISSRFKKRAFDLIFSSFVIVFVMSWLYPICGLLIKLESKGPILFKQQRSGRKNLPFWCLKFRSMSLNNDNEEKQAVKNDARITRIGRFLRRTSLDEMPQFFNVFLGNMSIVGPRPHMLAHTEKYELLIDKFMVRHFVKPGITGWAQVHGFRGETKNVVDMENRVKFDIHYLENWTAMLDVKIVFMTIINMLRGEDNAY